MDNVPGFEGCDGVRYALLCIVPTFYIASAVLFWALGIVLQVKKWTKKKSYSVFRNEEEEEEEENKMDTKEVLVVSEPDKT